MWAITRQVAMQPCGLAAQAAIVPHARVEGIGEGGMAARRAPSGPSAARCCMGGSRSFTGERGGGGDKNASQAGLEPARVSPSVIANRDRVSFETDLIATIGLARMQ